MNVGYGKALFIKRLEQKSFMENLYIIIMDLNDRNPIRALPIESRILWPMVHLITAYTFSISAMSLFA